MNHKMKMLKRGVSLVLALIFSALLFTGCAMNGDAPQGQNTSSGDSGGEEKVLNIFTWATYFPDDILEEFTQQTGIKVQYSNFDSNEEMLMKLQASNGSDYDIVLASDYIIDMARKQELIAKLDKSQIPNFENINPDFQSKFYDENNEYTVPYSAGVPVLIYNPDLVNIPIQGYEDLWNPALNDSVVLMDDARNVIGLTLKTMGESFNTTDSDTLNQAKEKLMELKPNILALDYNTSYQKLINGEASVGYMFTSQAATALLENENLKVVYPKEGVGFGIDSCFIPVNAPHPSNAHQFLNFILDPQRSAHISEQTLYINCNQAATPYVEQSSLPDSVKNQVLTVPEDLLKDAEFIQDIGTDASELYQNIWTEFKQS